MVGPQSTGLTHRRPALALINRISGTLFADMCQAITRKDHSFFPVFYSTLEAEITLVALAGAFFIFPQPITHLRRN